MSTAPVSRPSGVVRTSARAVGRTLARRLAGVQPRRALLAAGKRMTVGQLSRLRIVLGALEQGHWLAQRVEHVPNRGDRFDVFAEALSRVRGTRPLYLEFGVHRGRTLRWWSRHLAAPGARFVGFDSFQGLPGDWGTAPAGSFAVDRLPEIADSRVSLVPGWFEQTLPDWEPPEHDQLIVNLDCDLYSSTAYVLDWLSGHLAPGTLVYFDDLFDHDDELRAVWEWLDEHGGAAAPVAMARWGQHLLFEYQG